MDKEWLKLDRLSDEYLLGLRTFIMNSIQVSGHNGEIKCPCKFCYNRYWEKPSIVEEHLVVDGMDSDYKRMKWIFHGESRTQHASQVQPDVANFDPPKCGMMDLLTDVFRHEYMAPIDDELEEPDLPTAPTPDAAEFFNLLKEADEDLYPGCKSMKKLDFLVHVYKIKCLYTICDGGLNAFLMLIKSILPAGETIPKSFYLTKKLISKFGLKYEKIHACPDDCMLYWKDRASYDKCTSCGKSRYKEYEDENGILKVSNVPQKVLRYFPLGPRLQRLYMSQHTSGLMTWHASERPNDGCMRHPSDSPAWKHLDSMYPVFAGDSRNVRLGLASDGFNPFGNMSSQHSTWPVILSIYNLPPWLCMKKPYLMLSLLIPGPKGPGNDIDIYLEPLIDELTKLWEEGISSYDACRKEQFTLRAAVLWTINDFPTYANLSGWSTKGKLACPNCKHGTHSKWLYNGKKHCYMGHRRWLPDDHEFRQNAESFDNSIELESAPIPMTGVDCLHELSNLTFTFGKATTKSSSSKQTLLNSNGKRPRVPPAYKGPWKKKSVFYRLPYWKHLLIRHNLDVMHIEKNVCDSVIGTLLGIVGKSKDSLNARLDMEAWNIRPDLHPIRLPHKTELKAAQFTMTPDEKTMVCESLASTRAPDGWSSNIARCVHVKERKLIGLKSHDCHVLMQQLLPLAIRNTLSDNVISVLLELSAYFRHLCSKTATIEHFVELKERIIIILCELEKIFPPAFFDIMVHLLVHLAEEAAIAGPVHYRWMYPIESYLGTLNDYVHNRSKPEGSIAEGYLVEECLSFCSMYLKDTETRRNRPGRNTDAGGRDVVGGLSIFSAGGRPLGKGEGKVIQLGKEELNLAHRCVLHNCPEVQELLDKHVADAKRNRGRRVTLLQAERAARASFLQWFEDHVNSMQVDRANLLSEDLRALAKGPSEWQLRHKKYVVNGFRFRVKSIDNKGTNQNSGVFIRSLTPSDPRERAVNPSDAFVDYYGVLTDIIELSYNAGRRIVLFKGDWVDSLVNGGGIKTDQYGFTLVNFNQLLPSNDPFILASQALQVFYVKDPLDKDWQIVVRTKARDLFDMGVSTEHDPCAPQDLSQLNDGTATVHVRNNVASKIINEICGVGAGDNACASDNLDGGLH